LAKLERNKDGIMAIRRTGTASMPTGIAYLIGRLHRMLRRRLGETLSPLGLTLQQYTMLAVLGARGQLSNAQLAERAFVTPQTANEMVKAMEANGWIERSPDPTHGRVIQLRLTPSGQSVLASAHAVTARLEDEMLVAIDADNRKSFHDQLRACVHALSL
jgi:DNA-binding MarR family transcriptional regulator